MKSSHKYYLTGFLTGLLVGAGFFLMFNKGPQKRKPSPFDLQYQNQNTASSSAREEQNTSYSENYPHNQTDGQGQQQHEKQPKETKDSLTQNPDDSLTEQHIEMPDTMNQDDPIMKDKLITKIRLPIIDSAASENIKGPNIDSLLIDDIAADPFPTDSLWVEFWQNPLNYRGYRRIHDRLILFGIHPDLPIAIFRKDEDLFLHIQNNHFPLKEYEEFRPIRIEE